MAKKIYKPFLEKISGTSASEYIGNPGELFYDPEAPTLRISNGTSAGGTVFGGGSGSSNQSLDTTSDVTFKTATITGSAGIENADGARITNAYYQGTLLVGSNLTQTPVSILIGGAGPRNEWAFTPDGTLTTPAGLSISKQIDGNNVHIGSSIQSDFNKNLRLQAIGTGSGSLAWQNFEGDVNFVTLNYNQSKNILISTGNAVGEGVVHNWLFASNGNIQLPAGGDIVDIAGNSVLGNSRVKLQSPGDRRIEEVYGYKEVSVTSPTVDVEFTGVTLSPTIGPAWDVFIDGTVYTDLFNYVNTNNYSRMTLAINGSSYQVDAYISGSNVVLFNIASTSVSYNEGDTFTVTKFVGGEPVVWWDRNELPGGGTDFRGATIDYHAFTGESTIIGTIHIVNDSGENHISHSEVQSGTTDGENDDLWLVTNEGQIQYRRIDKEAKTLKVQWSAKVFYGSEFYD